MEKRYPLAEGRGWLSVRQNGLRAECEAELPDDGCGLYKLYLRGAGGSYLLGTPMPEGGRLRLRRTVTLDTLCRGQAWPPTGAAAELSFAFKPHGGQCTAGGLGLHRRPRRTAR